MIPNFVLEWDQNYPPYWYKYTYAYQLERIWIRDRVLIQELSLSNSYTENNRELLYNRGGVIMNKPGNFTAEMKEKFPKEKGESEADLKKKRSIGSFLRRIVLKRRKRKVVLLLHERLEGIG